MQSSPPSAERRKRFLLQEIAGDQLLEVEQMGLSPAAGTNDAATFPDYHIYTSNQTCNTVLLAVRALGSAESFSTSETSALASASTSSGAGY